MCCVVLQPFLSARHHSSLAAVYGLPLPYASKTLQRFFPFMRKAKITGSDSPTLTANRQG